MNKKGIFVTATVLITSSGFAQRQTAQSNGEIESLVASRLKNCMALVKEGNIGKAEEQLSLAEGLSTDKYVCFPMRSHIQLLKGDQKRAYQTLKLYFEGDLKEKNAKRGVIGAEALRPWYWYLALQYDGKEKASEIKRKWFKMHPVTIPLVGTELRPESYTTNDLAQVYLWLAAWECPRDNMIQAKRYLTLAKRADSSFKAPAQFAELFEVRPYNFTDEVIKERKSYAFPSFNSFDTSAKSIGVMIDSTVPIRTLSKH